MSHACIHAVLANVSEVLWLYGVTVIWSESGRRKAQKKKTVQMPSPGLLNLRGSKGKRDSQIFRRLQFSDLTSNSSNCHLLAPHCAQTIKGFMVNIHQ